MSRHQHLAVSSSVSHSSHPQPCVSPGTAFPKLQPQGSSSTNPSFPLAWIPISSQSLLTAHSRLCLSGWFGVLGRDKAAEGMRGGGGRRSRSGGWAVFGGSPLPGRPRPLRCSRSICAPDVGQMLVQRRGMPGPRSGTATSRVQRAVSPRGWIYSFSLFHSSSQAQQRGHTIPVSA